MSLMRSTVMRTPIMRSPILGLLPGIVKSIGFIIKSQSVKFNLKRTIDDVSFKLR
jgi:hypothetical protein